MNVYSMFYSVLKNYYPHNKSDIFDPNHPFFGNTNVKVVTEGGSTTIKLIDSESPGIPHDSDDMAGPRLVDWLFTTHLDQDLRMGYLLLNDSNKIVSNIDWNPCQIYQISPISNRPVCYSTEALKYAQTAFFFGIVCGQLYNSLALKTNKASVMYQGLKNVPLILGWVTEFSLCLFLAYIRPINQVFGTRDVTFQHFIIPGALSAFTLLFWEECRKWLIRHFPTDDPKHPNWFERNVRY